MSHALMYFPQSNKFLILLKVSEATYVYRAVSEVCLGSVMFMGMLYRSRKFSFFLLLDAISDKPLHNPR